VNGKNKSYYENGQLKSIGNYVDDKLNGEFKSFHENGELYDTSIFSNDHKKLKI
jgi:antitoxin component YwqK of YwqJK toxin-antitoxin module